MKQTHFTNIEHVRDDIDFTTKRDPSVLYAVSCGGGVNSIAMIIELIERKAPLDIIVFADTGAEMPETLAYIPYFQKAYLDKHNHKIITAKNKHGSLQEISEKNHIIPLPASRRRWCTTDVKIIPVKQTCRKIMSEREKKKLIQYVGFASDEAHRIKPDPKQPKYIKTCYPLNDLKITRDGCKKIIASQNLLEPIRSGCYFCQYQSKAKWQKLYEQHPELYDKAVEFEKQAYDTDSKKPLFFNWSAKKPLSLDKMRDSFKNQTKLDIDDKEFSDCPQGCYDL